jgi:Transposase
MQEVSTIGLDLAKHVFQAHGASASGAVVFRKRLRRDQVLSFFASQPRCRVAMEACASAHHWARAIGSLGHEVRLIPPAYVKPFVKRQKNDMADAEAICEAAQRPTMRFVAVKSETKQASAVIFRARSAGRPTHSDHQRRSWSSGGVWSDRAARAGTRRATDCAGRRSDVWRSRGGTLLPAAAREGAATPAG